MRSFLLFCCCLFLALPALARDIGGVTVAESLEGSDGVMLLLNGAGIRTKVFFKIYIAELYLQNPGTDAKAVLADDSQKRMVMHFLYDELTKEKMVEVWNEGFAANASPDQLTALKERIQQFNDMFVTVKKGDQVVLDYLPGAGTKVTIAGTEKGLVPGKDFNDVLLSIWLGEKPISADLKKQLLSGK